LEIIIQRISIMSASPSFIVATKVTRCDQTHRQSMRWIRTPEVRRLPSFVG